MPDVFKILKDLELKAVGLDEQTKKMQEGYFVSFRSIGLPIRAEDFVRPWGPSGSTPRAQVPALPAQSDPAAAPATGSEGLDPEQVYDDALTADLARGQRAYVNTFLLTDSKLTMSPDYSAMPGASKVSTSWWAITTGANGVPQDLHLDPDLQAEYDRAQAVLTDADGEVTRTYERYLEFQDEYRSKVRSYNKAYAAAFTDPRKLQQWPMEGKLYKDEVDEAWDRWQGIGGKQKVENAIAVLAARGTDPAIALIARAKKQFEGNLFNFPGVGNIPYTMMLPSNWADPTDDEGWNRYSSRDFHSETHYSSSSTSYGGGAGIDVGFWRAGGSFTRSQSREHLDMSTTNLEVSFDYCVVDVLRPWLDTSLLNLDNWFLHGDYPAGTISDGGMGQHVPAQNEPTFLPSLVTSLVLVKDLCIKWDDWQHQWDSRTSSTEAGACFGWGPFAVKGSYGSEEHSFDCTTDRRGEGLRSEGIQLVGYVSQINPRSPRLNGADHLNH